MTELGLSKKRIRILDDMGLRPRGASLCAAVTWCKINFQNYVNLTSFRNKNNIFASFRDNILISGCFFFKPRVAAISPLSQSASIFFVVNLNNLQKTKYDFGSKCGQKRSKIDVKTEKSTSKSI